MAEAAADLGHLPVWDLNDLYSGGIESAPLKADLERAAALPAK